MQERRERRPLNLARHMWNGTQLLILVVASLCTVSACSDRKAHELQSKNHDQVLFEMATNAVRQKRLSIANIELQTLVNTYPESKYANRAKHMLRDPRIVRCGGGFSNTPISLCDPGAAAAHLKSMSVPF